MSNIIPVGAGSGPGSQVGNLLGFGPGTVHPSDQRFQDPMQPYYAAYAQQLYQLIQHPESVTQTPEYKFQFGQGERAIEGSSAARGTLNSGNTLAALTEFGQGLASQSYYQQVATLASLARGNPAYGNLYLQSQLSNFNETIGALNEQMNIYKFAASGGSA